MKEAVLILIVVIASYPILWVLHKYYRWWRLGVFTKRIIEPAIEQSIKHELESGTPITPQKPVDIEREYYYYKGKRYSVSDLEEHDTKYADKLTEIDVKTGRIRL